jgi:cyclic-di-GMP phosphodiesterase TipF (flagellum assembly factor)
MGDLVEFISQNRYLAPRLIFELSQKDIMDPDLLTPEMDNVLNGLARLGCRFSMDGIDQLPIDSRFLNAKHIRYVKIDAPVLLQKMAEQGGFQRLRRMKDEFDRNGIDLIVTHIEAEKELIELLDLEIDYGQGFLFGAPEKTPAI